MTEQKAPEEVVTDALVMTDLSDYAGTDMGMINQAVGSVLAALRAAGLLVGDPTEEQIERAARAIWERYAGHGPWETLSPDRQAPFRKDARAALAAAGVAPRARVKPVATSAEPGKNEADSSHVAPQEPPAVDPMDESHTTYWICGTCGAKEHVRGATMTVGPQHVCEGEPAQVSDREKLIAKATARINEWSPGGQCPSDIGLIVLLRDALAALPVVDEAKLTEVIRNTKLDGGRHLDRIDSRVIARAVIEWWEKQR